MSIAASQEVSKFIGIHGLILNRLTREIETHNLHIG